MIVWRVRGKIIRSVLCRTSFSEDANALAASLLTRDCLVFVRWPCNVLRVIMPFGHSTPTSQTGQRDRTGQDRTDNGPIA